MDYNAQPLEGSVLDSKHGIETTYLGIERGYEYKPWYVRNGHSFYYTACSGWSRVVYGTYHDAYNHIARSRRMKPLPYPLVEQ